VADFFAQTEKLAKMVGDGILEGVFVVDGGGRTVPLEVGYWRNHMGRNGRVEIRNYHDGGPHAAQKSLEETYQPSLADIAKTTLKTGPQEAMERHVERVNERFKVNAPKRTGQYSESTRRVVLDDGMPVYDERGASYGEEPND